MQIGFTSTTFKKLDPIEICDLAVTSGADCIEWSDLHIPHPARAREIAARCAGSGVACCSLGSYYHVGENDASRWKNLCETAAALGAGWIRVWLGRRGSAETGEEEYAALLADAKRMTRLAANCGLTVAAEAHPNTCNDSCAASLRFLRDLAEPGFATYFQSLYLDMPADLDRLARTFPYTRAAHVSFSEVPLRLRLPGEGRVESVVRALIQRVFQGPVLLEFVSRDDPGAFARDMARLRAIVKDEENRRGQD